MLSEAMMLPVVLKGTVNSGDGLKKMWAKIWSTKFLIFFIYIYSYLTAQLLELYEILNLKLKKVIIIIKSVFKSRPWQF